MFEIPPEWDKEKKYAVENLIAYYENKSLKKVFPIDVNSKLGTILPAKTYVFLFLLHWWWVIFVNTF